MVKYFNFTDTLPALAAGQRTGDRIRKRKSLKEFARSMAGKNYGDASSTLAEMGDVDGSLKVRRIPMADEADRLGNDFTRTRIADIGTDNRRADQKFAYARQQGERRNALDEAKLRLGQGNKNTALQSDYNFAQNQGYEGSLMDFQRDAASAKKPPQHMPTIDRRSVLEAEERAFSGQNVIRSIDEALSLNDKALHGPAASARASVGAAFGHDASEAALQMENLITTRALESLKSTFGGMPTEGERKILIEIQGSINQPPAVRADIFKRARALAERRIQYNKGRADDIRSGDIYQPGYGQNNPHPGQGKHSGTASNGAHWSIE